MADVVHASAVTPQPTIYWSCSVNRPAAGAAAAAVERVAYAVETRDFEVVAAAVERTAACSAEDLAASARIVDG